MSSNNSFGAMVILLIGFLISYAQPGLSTMEIGYNSCIYSYMIIDTTNNDTLNPQQVSNLKTCISNINDRPTPKIPTIEGWYFSNVVEAADSTLIIPFLEGFDICLYISFTYNSTPYGIDTCFTIDKCHCEEQPIIIEIHI